MYLNFITVVVLHLTLIQFPIADVCWNLSNSNVRANQFGTLVFAWQFVTFGNGTRKVYYVGFNSKMVEQVSRHGNTKLNTTWEKLRTLCQQILGRLVFTITLFEAKNHNKISNR